MGHKQSYFELLVDHLSHGSCFENCKQLKIRRSNCHAMHKGGQELLRLILVPSGPEEIVEEIDRGENTEHPIEKIKMLAIQIVS